MKYCKSDKRKVLFIMTVDTEEEWDWGGEFPKENFSVQNTQKIPKFQNFCNELGVKPTYFVDYAIISDKDSVERLNKPLKRGECEIGAHLHPWCTPPVEEEIIEENTHIVNLQVDLVRKKLKNLTQKIEDEFGERPLSFRSGRWGMNGEILKMLSEEGYTIESSVFPFYADSSFSYHDAPDVPYWPDFSHFPKKGTQREIFEIPVSSGFNLQYFNLCNKIHRHLASKPWRHFHIIGILWRLHLLRKLRLSPELGNASDMISCIDACLRRGHRVIHMFFHSSSLLPGASPYVSNESEENLLYKNIEDVISYMKESCTVSFCTLAEAKRRYFQEKN